MKDPMTPAEASIKCKCGSLPQIVLGCTSKLPTKHFEVITTKPHPANPFAGPGGSRTWVTLGRCKACGQLWQADAWTRNVGFTSWPQLCIKIDSEGGWPEFDDRPLRLAYFPEMVNGLEGDCATPKCGDMAVIGMSTCANCACKARYAGVDPAPRTWGSASPADPGPSLRSGRHIPLGLLLAVAQRSEAAGVRAFREAYPGTSLSEAREAFSELVAQWPPKQP